MRRAAAPRAAVSIATAGLWRPSCGPGGGGRWATAVAWQAGPRAVLSLRREIHPAWRLSVLALKEVERVCAGRSCRRDGASEGQGLPAKGGGLGAKKYICY